MAQTPAAPITPVVTPVLSVPSTIIAGAAGSASFDKKIDGLTYNWTLLNATLTGASGDQQITFTAGSVGQVIYTVTVTNQVNDSAIPASAVSQVVADLQVGYQPVILAPVRAVAGRSGNRAVLTNPIAGVTYTWSASGATIDTTASDSSSASFTGTSAGTATVQVAASVTGAIGGATATGSATVAVEAVPSAGLTLVSGTVGGPGYLDGAIGNARFPLRPTTANEDMNIIAAPDGTIWFADAATCTLRVIQSGIVSTIGQPYDCRTVDSAPATPARVNFPQQLALADNGDIWFIDNTTFTSGASTLDASRQVVRRASLDGTVKTWSTATATTSVNCTLPNGPDGTPQPLTPSGSSAVYCQGPSGITSIDGAGSDLFVATSSASFSFNNQFAFNDKALFRYNHDGSAAQALYMGDYLACNNGNSATTITPGCTQSCLTCFDQCASGDTVCEDSCTATCCPQQLGFSHMFSDGTYVYWMAQTADILVGYGGTPAEHALLRYDPATASSSLWPAGAACMSSPTTTDFLPWGTGGTSITGLIAAPGPTFFGVGAHGASIFAYDNIAAVTDFSTQPPPRTVAGQDTGVPAVGVVDGAAATARFDYALTNTTHDVHPLALGYLASNTTPNALYLLDTGNTAIRQITPIDAASTATVSTLLGGPYRSGVNNAPAATATFNAPTAIAVDFDDTVYVADSGNGMLRQIDRSGNATTLFGSGAPAIRDGGPNVAALSAVSSMVVRPDRTVLFADKSTIRVFDPATQQTTIFLGSAQTAGLLDGGAGSALLGASNISLALAPDGTVAVADPTNNAIRVITTTNEIATLTSTSSFGNAPTGGQTPGGANNGFGSSFGYPMGIAVGSDGTYFVADTRDSQIRSVTLSEKGLVVATVAGDISGSTIGFCGISDGPCACDKTVDSYCAGSAHFRNPTAIAVQPNGDLVVLDTWQSGYCTDDTIDRSPTVRLVHHPEDPASCQVTTVAGNADPKFNAVQLKPLPAAFNTPTGLVIGPAQDYWLVDTKESAVLQLELAQ